MWRALFASHCRIEFSTNTLCDEIRTSAATTCTRRIHATIHSRTSQLDDSVECAQNMRASRKRGVTSRVAAARDEAAAAITASARWTQHSRAQRQLRVSRRVAKGVRMYVYPSDIRLRRAGDKGLIARPRNGGAQTTAKELRSPTNNASQMDESHKR